MAEKSFGESKRSGAEPEQIRATHARLDERLPGRVPERPDICACVRHSLMGAANRRASHPTDATIFPLLGDVAFRARCLCTQGVPETTFRTLFVFFNFARNSIFPSSPLCAGWKRELRSAPCPSRSSLFPFVLRDRNFVDSKLRRGQAET